jgi:hypothetical protein
MQVNDCRLLGWMIFPEATSSCLAYCAQCRTLTQQLQHCHLKEYIITVSPVQLPYSKDASSHQLTTNIPEKTVIPRQIIRLNALALNY